MPGGTSDRGTPGTADRGETVRRKFVLLPLLSVLSLVAALFVTQAGAKATPATTISAQTKPVTSSSLGEGAPTFTGPAATGCASAGCSLLTGPTSSPSTAGTASHTASQAATDHPAALPDPRRTHAPHVAAPRATAPVIPAVSCQPRGPGCDRISTSPGGAVGVKGLNAVDSGTLSTNVLTPRDLEPPDQGLCAGNGYVVEDNNIGEILVFNQALHRQSSVISLDTLMGLTSLGYSSGGDISCSYDYSNGGHWFFTEFVSTTSEARGGAFSGCFAGVANSCLEGIAVTDGPSPFGPYHVYFLHADYNPAEPGYPYLLNDFVKISTTRDAFLLFYDEFPLNPDVPGLGGGAFNGAQEFAFNKKALELGLPVTLADGKPDPLVTVAVENMGLIPTPDGTCAGTAGVTCWAAAIPAQPPDPSQYDNSHGGSGFMVASLDFNSFAALPSSGDNRMAVFDWTGLGNLNSPGCATCSGIAFGGQLFSGVQPYYGPGSIATQKSGPVPLGEECGAAGLSVSPAAGEAPPASCPENGLATNGDFMTQVSQAREQLWGATTTEVSQSFSGEASPEIHQGAAYWVIGTRSFDSSGVFSLTGQGYVSAAHEDLTMPAMAAEGLPGQDGGNGGAIMTFTLTGNGGPTGADNGGFYPSTAFGRLAANSGGLLGSVVNIADLGQSPEDGFTEYLGYPGATSPRWGDYSNAIFLPGSGGRIYFANEYIQSPNCLAPAFTLTVPTCSGTRDDLANWGTSMNSVVP